MLSSPGKPLYSVGGSSIVKGEVVVNEYIQSIGRQEADDIQEACVG